MRGGPTLQPGCEHRGDRALFREGEPWSPSDDPGGAEGQSGPQLVKLSADFSRGVNKVWAQGVSGCSPCRTLPPLNV